VTHKNACSQKAALKKVLLSAAVSLGRRGKWFAGICFNFLSYLTYNTEKVKGKNLANKTGIQNMLFGVDLLRTEVVALSVASI
jgi:hypothetical protein